MKSFFIKGVSFEDVWNRLSAEEKNLCCTRSYESEGWDSFIGWNPVGSCVVTGRGSASRLKDYVFCEQASGRRVFGYVSYDVGYYLLDVPNSPKVGLSLPDVCFYSFCSYILCVSGGIEIVSSDEASLGVYLDSVRLILRRTPRAHGVSFAGSTSGFTSRTARGAYSEAYKKIRQYILDGDIYQINLAHMLEGETLKNSRDLFSDVCDTNRVGFIAYIEGNGFEVLSASPEEFIKVSSEGGIETRPIKGTRKRGKSGAEDIAMMNDLMSSEKEAAELNMITDLLRNDLGKISCIGSVSVVSARVPRAHNTVWHTSSHITGRLLPGLKSVDALLSMFPGGSITGCPKKRAVEIIDELETVRRGVYTGCIGFIDPDDSAVFNIAIRTIVKKKQKVFLHVGGGVVFDSKETDEYQETLDKAKSFLSLI